MSTLNTKPFKILNTVTFNELEGKLNTKVHKYILSINLFIHNNKIL